MPSGSSYSHVVVGHLAQLPWLPLALAAFLLWWLSLVLYRLYLHPLAKFPGPRLAAATSWYEAYYEILKDGGGQYGKQIWRLHDRYGPIIRVTPHELHIRDPRFFSKVYPRNAHIDREGWARRFGAGGLLSTTNAEVHKRRRAALAPMFSKRAVLDLVHIIQRHIETLTSRLADFEERQEPINFTRAYPALTGEIIMDYAFGFNQGQLKHPEFNSFREAFELTGMVGHLATQFPIVPKILKAVPPWMIEKMNPEARPLAQFLQQQKDAISKTIAGEDIKVNDAKRTVFRAILDSDLPPEDKTLSRLQDEPIVIIGGGVETTAFTLVIATWHITHNPSIYAKLHAELVAAFPNRNAIDLQTCESLPYLKAVITEALRLSYGISARNSRTHYEPLVYGDWVIPARTNIAMTIPFMSHDEEFFPDSKTFIPERWLGSPKTKDGLPLSDYMVSFGRGTRSCLGINLAWTELYLILATLFRRYALELHEPDVADAQMDRDMFVPRPKASAKGCRAFVRSTTD